MEQPLIQIRPDHTRCLQIKRDHLFFCTRAYLAYEMNGNPLPELHGAPLRLRNELEFGFKQVKWVQAVEFVGTFKQLGSGEGGFNEDNEYYGYRAPL